MRGISEFEMPIRALAASARWPRVADNRVMAVGRSLARPQRYAVLAAGALPALAFPAPDLAPVAWFALVPGLLLIHRAGSPREAAVRGGWLGAGYLLATLWWLVPNIGPGLLLVAVAFGALWAGVGLAVWALLRPPVTVRRALAAVFVTPSAWLVIELSGRGKLSAARGRCLARASGGTPWCSGWRPS